MESWTDWENIRKLPDINKNAVYRIRIVDKNDEPFRINRFLAIDESGLLAIGATSDIRKRLSIFRKIALDEKKGYHAEALTLHLLKRITNFQNKFHNYEIQYSYRLSPNEKDKEKEVLEEYYKKFGETPPLNHKREFIKSDLIRKIYF